MSKTKTIYTLLQVWEDGASQLVACYAKKEEAENRRDFISKIARLTEWVVVEVPFVKSLKKK